MPGLVLGIGQAEVVDTRLATPQQHVVGCTSCWLHPRLRACFSPLATCCLMWRASAMPSGLLQAQHIDELGLEVHR